MERATGLLLEITGGEAGPVIEVVSEQHLPSIAPVTLRASRVEQMLGLVIENAEIERLLKGLGLAVTAEADGQWRVEVPSHRFDISLEVDLIEELARLYGYNRLPVRYPQARLAPQAKAEAKGDLPELRRLLVARGYQEAITYSFIDPKWFELFSPGAKPLLLANPISTTWPPCAPRYGPVWSKPCSTTSTASRIACGCSKAVCASSVSSTA